MRVLGLLIGLAVVTSQVSCSTIYRSRRAVQLTERGAQTPKRGAPSGKRETQGGRRPPSGLFSGIDSLKNNLFNFISQGLLGNSQGSPNKPPNKPAPPRPQAPPSKPSFPPSSFPSAPSPSLPFPSPPDSFFSSPTFSDNSFSSPSFSSSFPSSEPFPSSFSMSFPAQPSSFPSSSSSSSFPSSSSSSFPSSQSSFPSSQSSSKPSAPFTSFSSSSSSSFPSSSSSSFPSSSPSASSHPVHGSPQHQQIQVKPFVHPEVAPMAEIEPFNVGISFHHNQPVTQGPDYVNHAQHLGAPAFVDPLKEQSPRPEVSGIIDLTGTTGAATSAQLALNPAQLHKLQHELWREDIANLDLGHGKKTHAHPTRRRSKTFDHGHSAKSSESVPQQSLQSESAKDKELVPEVIVVVADATPRPAGQIPNFQILDETVEEIFEKKSDVLAEDEA